MINARVPKEPRECLEIKAGYTVVTTTNAWYDVSGIKPIMDGGELKDVHVKTTKGRTLTAKEIYYFEPKRQ